MGEEASKKKLVTIGITSVILVACIVAVAVSVKYHSSPAESNGNGPSPGGKLSSSSKAVEALCQPTDYKQTCKESLSSAGNTTDPKELIKIAFNYTVNKIGEGIKQSETLKELEKDPRGKKALDNCKELIDYAIDDLKRSIDELGDLDVTKFEDVINNLQIWLSATVTYQETCLDGFQNTTGNAGESMRMALNTSMELTSNALAMVTNVTTILSEMNIPYVNRRLLSEEAEEPEEPVPHHDLPPWLHHTRRALLEATPTQLTPNVVVAQDGSGKYKTINEALKDVPVKGTTPFIIYVKEGIYKEYVFIEKTMTHVMMYGDGPLKTKITGNKNFADGTPTFQTATVAVVGNNFMAKDIGFENTAGAEGHQAVALRVSSDQSIFYNCQIDGYQDTLYVHAHRQFYRDCTITGTIDFVFGDSPAVLQNCTFFVRRPMENQQCIVTAQGRKDRNSRTAIIIQGGAISADPTLIPVKNVFKSYLGRPWKEYSRTIIVNTQIDDLIAPEGWLPWTGTFGINTCFYAEINNKGPGADKSNRVKWKGIKNINANHATAYVPKKFFKIDTWITEANTPYTPTITV